MLLYLMVYPFLLYYIGNVQLVKCRVCVCLHWHACVRMCGMRAFVCA